MLRSRSSQETESRLRLVQVNIHQADAADGMTTYGTDALWFGIEAFPKVLEVLPGVSLKVETRLTSEDGQIQNIHVTLRTKDGDDLGSFSFNYKGEFVSGQSYGSPEQLGFAKIFKHPQQVANLLKPHEGVIFESGKNARLIEVGTGETLSLTEPGLEKPYAFQLEALVPNFITRPVFSRIHLSPESKVKGQTVDFVIDQVIDSTGRKKIFASLFQHQLMGKDSWQTRTVFFPELADPQAQVPVPCWFCSNEDPLFDFESTVSEKRSKNPASLHHGAFSIITYDLELKNISPALVKDQGRLVIDLEEEGGSYHYKVYWLKNWSPEQKRRTPTAAELVGESDWNEFQGLEAWTIHWLKPEFQEAFNENFDEIKKQFEPNSKDE